jgi:hypothetical protein
VRADPYREWHDIQLANPIADAADIDVDEAAVFQSDRARDRIRASFRESTEVLFWDERGHASVVDTDAVPFGHQPETSTGGDAGPSFTNVYLSRAFKHGVGPDDAHIHEAVAAELRSHSVPVANQHPPERYSIGSPDEVMMVTFVGRVVLDGLLPIAEPDGHLDSYNRLTAGDDPNQEQDGHQDHSWRIIASHTIGLGGAWDR